MSRIARIVLPGIPCHVTQRGNGRQRIFFAETDHRLYLDLLREQSAQAGLVLWAYCLMPNHVHLIAVPTRPAALAQTLGRTHASFARHFNLNRRSCGHVWQARFFSCPLDEAHVWQAMAYVERNPVRAGMVADAGQYRWSSAAAHLTGHDRDALLDLAGWRREYDPQRWKRVLETSVDEEALGQRIHEASRRGRALGSEAFVKELESRSGRRLRPHPVGRPNQTQHRQPQQLALANCV
jgi:putative transposase